MKPLNTTTRLYSLPFAVAPNGARAGNGASKPEFSQHLPSSGKKIPNERAKFLSSPSFSLRPAFTGPTFVNSGYQSLSDIVSTEFVFRAAEKIVNSEGKIDTGEVSALLRKVLVETMQGVSTLSNPHRTHVGKALRNLLRVDLQEAIHNVCAKPGSHPQGNAESLVRATLKLRPETDVTATHARKAVVMCLLGNLRQHAGVGSCFATAIAISLLETQPLVVVDDLKSILEKNVLTVQIENKNYVIPVNMSIHMPNADIQMALESDGNCVGTVGNDTLSQPFELQMTPGMGAALTVLGHDEEQWGKAIQDSLLHTTLHNGTHGASCRDIIEQLAKASTGSKPLSEKVALAGDAFSGQENVRLLRAWEYTLASSAEAANLDLASTAVFGDELSQRSDLRSLLTCVSGYESVLAADPELLSAPLGEIYMNLLMDLAGELNERFSPQFVANMKWDEVADDGESSFGAFKLVYRGIDPEATSPASIDNREIFRERFIELLDHAAQKGLDPELMRQLDGDIAQNTKALVKFVDHLKAYIRTPEFMEYVCIRINTVENEESTKTLSECTRFPWGCFQQGGNIDSLMEMYGGKIYRQQESVGMAWHKLDDIIHFIGNTLTTLAPTFDPAMVKTGIFLLPTANEPHAFRLLTKPFQDIWTGKVSVENWINEQLIKPALSSQNTQTKDVRIADSNWSNNHGDACYLSLTYNTQSKEIELHSMNEDGSGRVKRDGKWLNGWRISSPLAARVLPS